MRISPITLAFLYFATAGIFFYATLQSDGASDTAWSFTTIVLLVVTAILLNSGIRLLRLYYLIKKHHKKK